MANKDLQRVTKCVSDIGHDPNFEIYLAAATRLPRDRAIKLYRAGSPWPLFTTQPIRKAAIYAQAKGLPIADALVLAEQEDDAEHAEMVRLMAEIQRLPAGPDRTRQVEAFSALPSIKEGQDHICRLMAVTQESSSTVVRMHLAVQRYAIAHPDWSLSGLGPVLCGSRMAS